MTDHLIWLPILFCARIKFSAEIVVSSQEKEKKDKAKINRHSQEVNPDEISVLLGDTTVESGHKHHKHHHRRKNKI